MELGRSWRTLLLMMLLLRPRGAGEVPGHRQQAALKDQRFRSSASTLMAPIPRARARRSRATRSASRPAIRAPRDRTDLLEPPGRWAAAGRTMVRSTAAPSRLVNLVGGDDGARAFAANAADDDVAVAAASRAARFSYGVMENRRPGVSLYGVINPIASAIGMKSPDRYGNRSGRKLAGRIFPLGPSFRYERARTLHRQGAG